MWEFKAKFGHWEVWKTPSKFLACYHYERIFVFTDTLKEAMEIAMEIATKGIGEEFKRELEIVNAEDLSNE